MSKFDKDLYDCICKEDLEYRKKQVEDGEITMEEAEFQHWMAVDDILWSMSDDTDEE